MIGTLTPKSATRAAISGTAVAASPLFTVTLTNCDPARASALKTAASNGYANDGTTSIVNVNMPPTSGLTSRRATSLA